MSLMKEEPGFEPGAEGTYTPKGWPIDWLTFLAIGWVLYELTAQPAAGVAAVCVKFGWEDFRTALWLRRTDPRYRRGKAFFWLYLAAGLGKTALVALAMIIPYSVIIDLRGRGPNPVQNLEVVLMATSATMIGSFALSGLSVTFACWDAYWGGFPLWLSRGVHRARRKNVWPPSLCVNEESNHLGALLLTVLLLLIVPAYFFCLLLILLVVQINFLFVPLVLLSIIGVICGSLTFGALVNRKLKASSPSACWDPHERPLDDPDAPWQDAFPSAKVE